MHIITWVADGANYKLETPSLKEALELITDLQQDKIKFVHIFEEYLVQHIQGHGIIYLPPQPKELK